MFLFLIDDRLHSQVGDEIFISSAFVPTESMPSWLGAVADANPFTIVTNASRGLYNGLPVGNDVWISLAWAAGLTVVFAALSVRKFTRTLG